MFISKKVLVIGVTIVVVLAAAIGGFAAVNAADNGSAETTQTAVTTLFDKIAEIYQQNTGTAIDPVQLQTAFQQAKEQTQAGRIDQMLQKLVEDGKITQEQADQWKVWWNSRPTTALTDEFKSWLESRPDIPEFDGGARLDKPGFGGCFGIDSQSFRIGPNMRGALSGIDR